MVTNQSQSTFITSKDFLARQGRFIDRFCLVFDKNTERRLYITTPKGKKKLEKFIKKSVMGATAVASIGSAIASLGGVGLGVISLALGPETGGASLGVGLPALVFSIISLGVSGIGLSTFSAESINNAIKNRLKAKINEKQHEESENLKKSLDLGGHVTLCIKTYIWEAAYEISRIYEYQLNALEDRDIEEFALIAAGQCIKFLSEYKKPIDFNAKTGEFSKLLINALLSGKYILDSKRDIVFTTRRYLDQGKQFTCKWPANKIFSKVGVRKRVKGTKYDYFTTKKTPNKKEYGYRALLMGERTDEKKYIPDNSYNSRKAYVPYNMMITSSELKAYLDQLDKKEPIVNLNQYIEKSYNIDAARAIFRGDFPNKIFNHPANFNDCEFNYANFKNIQLPSCKMQRVICIDGYFENSNFDSAHMQDSYFLRTIFKKPNFRGTNFQGSDLRYMSMTDPKVNEYTLFNKKQLRTMRLDDCDENELKKLDGRIPLCQGINYQKSLKETQEKYIKLELKQSALESKQNALEERMNRLELNNLRPIGSLYRIEEQVLNYCPIEEAYRQLDLTLKDESRVVLVGPYGSGKTQLAIQYAKNYDKCHKGVICWQFHANNPITLQIEYKEFALKLGLPERVVVLKDIVSFVQDALDVRSVAGYLFIFDQVENEKIIEPYLPKSNPNVIGKVIITTQNSNLCHRLSYILNSVEVKGFNEYEVQKFLGQSFDKKDCEKLINAFGKIPQMVSSVKQDVSQYGGNIDDYIAILNYKRSNSMSNNLIKEEDQSTLLERVYKLYINSLFEKTKSFLNYLSCLSPEKIKKQLIFEIIKGMDDDITSSNNDIEIERYIKYKQYINDLSTYSLISEIQDKKPNEYINLSRIAQRICLNSLTKEQKKMIVKKLLRIFASFMTYDNRSVKASQNNRDLLPHLAVLFFHCGQLIDQNEADHELLTLYWVLKAKRATYYSFHYQAVQAREFLEDILSDIENRLSLKKIPQLKLKGFNTKNIFEKLSNTMSEEFSKNDYKDIFDALTKYDSRLPTIYAQVLYQLGRTFLAIGGKDVLYESYLIEANAMRKWIDRTDPSQINDEFNEGYPRKMDSILFVRQGMLAFYQKQIDRPSSTYQKQIDRPSSTSSERSDRYHIMIKQYSKLISEEKNQPEEKHDVFHLRICSRDLSILYLRIANEKSKIDNIPSPLDSSLNAWLEQEPSSGFVKNKKFIDKVKCIFKYLENSSHFQHDQAVSKDYNHLGNVLLKKINNVSSSKNNKKTDEVKELMSYAKQCFKKAIALETPKGIGMTFMLGDAYYGLAKVLYLEGKLEKAKNINEKAIVVLSPCKNKFLTQAQKLKEKIELNLNFFMKKHDVKGKKKKLKIIEKKSLHSSKNP